MYTVYKLNLDEEVVWHYPAQILSQGPNFVRLAAFFNRDDIDLGYTTFARGDRFIEYFYSDRWYNVFAVYEGRSERLRGWYCNVCRPARLTADGVWCVDLALDVWVPPVGEPLVLDEDEFAALPLADEERAAARQGLVALLQLAERQALPR